METRRGGGAVRMEARAPNHLAEALRQRVADMETHLKAKEKELADLKHETRATRVHELEVQSRTYLLEVRRLQQRLQHMESAAVEGGWSVDVEGSGPNNFAAVEAETAQLREELKVGQCDPVERISDASCV